MTLEMLAWIIAGIVVLGVSLFWMSEIWARRRNEQARKEMKVRNHADRHRMREFFKALRRRFLKKGVKFTFEKVSAAEDIDIAPYSGCSVPLPSGVYLVVGSGTTHEHIRFTLSSTAEEDGDDEGVDAFIHELAVSVLKEDGLMGNAVQTTIDVIYAVGLDFMATKVVDGGMFRYEEVWNELQRLYRPMLVNARSAVEAAEDQEQQIREALKLKALELAIKPPQVETA